MHVPLSPCPTIFTLFVYSCFFYHIFFHAPQLGAKKIAAQVLTKRRTGLVLFFVHPEQSDCFTPLTDRATPNKSPCLELIYLNKNSMIFCTISTQHSFTTMLAKAFSAHYKKKALPFLVQKKLPPYNIPKQHNKNCIPLFTPQFEFKILYFASFSIPLQNNQNRP